MDDVQYGLGEGPCLLAVQSRHTQTSGSLGGEPRWPRFGPRVGRMGVHSVLSLPLLLPDRVVGAINVYAHAKGAFGADAVRIGELFARPAAVSVHNAQVLAQSQRLAAQLEEALTNRAIIDQALGVIRSRTGADPEEAFNRLRAISQSQHVKVAEVSRVLMEEAVRRARARHAQPQNATAPHPEPAIVALIFQAPCRATGRRVGHADRNHPQPRDAPRPAGHAAPVAEHRLAASDPGHCPALVCTQHTCVSVSSRPSGTAKEGSQRSMRLSGEHPCRSRQR
jgi:hypothetical protein